MDIGSILLGVALLLVVVFFVARPLTEQGAARERELTPGDQLSFERDRTLTALRDLDFDHATGKILDEDYAAQRAQLVAQGVGILKQLDALASRAPRSNGHAPASAEDEIEQAVARLRGRARPAAPSRAAAPTATAKPATTTRSVDDEIEASVKARRQAAPAAAGNPCPKCGAATGVNDRFCPTCGTELAGVCDQCGRRARPDDRFCGNCGAPLDAAGNLTRAQVKG
jgi:hypothetical protein